MQKGWASSQEKIGAPAAMQGEPCAGSEGAEQVARPRPAPSRGLRYGFELNSTPKHCEE